jgi:hypothetical protein
MGDSIIIDTECETPYAAKLNFGSIIRAMMDVRMGLSAAIINQVAESGNQNLKMYKESNSLSLYECMFLGEF